MWMWNIHFHSFKNDDILQNEIYLFDLSLKCQRFVIFHAKNKLQIVLGNHLFALFSGTDMIIFWIQMFKNLSFYSIGEKCKRWIDSMSSLRFNFDRDVAISDITFDETHFNWMLFIVQVFDAMNRIRSNTLHEQINIMNNSKKKNIFNFSSTKINYLWIGEGVCLNCQWTRSQDDVFRAQKSTVYIAPGGDFHCIGKANA